MWHAKPTERLALAGTTWIGGARKMVGVELFEIQSEFSRNPRTSLANAKRSAYTCSRMRCLKSPNDFFFVLFERESHPKIVGHTSVYEQFFY